MTTTVDELAQSIRSSVRSIKHIRVRGDVGRVTVAPSGHTYFEMIGENSRIGCVAWSSSNVNVASGAVEAVVKHVDFYGPQGKCQAIISSVARQLPTPSRRDVLLDKLRQDGVLDRPKRPIPDFVSHLCVITSNGSAACADMMRGVSDRWPGLRTTVIHSLVQGDRAPTQLDAAFRMAHTLDPLPDVIVCGRGGGSDVDLEAFDAEETVLAFASSRIPVICAVGHETDHRICDVVADLRAKTPTAAIEVAIRVTHEECVQAVRRLREKSYDSLDRVLRRCCERLAFSAHMADTAVRNALRHADERVYSCQARIGTSVVANIQRQIHRLTQTKSRLDHHMHRLLRQFSAQVVLMACKLDGVAPHTQLKRGFALVDDARSCGRVRSIHDVICGDQINVRLQDGVIETTVKRCRVK